MLVLDNVVYIFVQYLKLEIMASKKKPEQRKLSEFFGKRKRENSEGCVIDLVNSTQDSCTQTSQECERSRRLACEVEDTSQVKPPTVPETECSQVSGDGECRSTFSSEALKQSKSFDPKWKENRPWLEYVPGSGMFCSYCKQFDKCPFGRDVWNKVGCVRLRLGSVKAHEQSTEHRDSVALHIQSETSKHIGDLLSNPKEVSRDHMVKAFQCLYFLAKCNIAHTTNFEKLLDLLTQLGLDVKSKICKGANAKYTSETSVKEFLLCLGEVIEQEILKEFHENKYYALMFDETTDISTIEQISFMGDM